MSRAAMAGALSVGARGRDGGLAGHRFFVGSTARPRSPSPGDVVHGLLWRLTPRDLAALHAYEMLHQGLYDVRHLPVRTGARRMAAMVYLLRRRAPGQPNPAMSR